MSRDALRTLICNKVDSIAWPTQRLINSALLDELSGKYAVPNDIQGNRTKAIAKAIENAIKRTVSKVDGTPGRQYFNALYNELVYEHVLDNRPNLRGIAFVHALYDLHGHADLISELDEVLIDTILAHFQALLKIQTYPEFAQPAPPTANRQVAVATALRRLTQKYGFSVHIGDGDIFLNSEDLRPACSDLERLITQYGGIHLANAIQGVLTKSGRYDSVQKRFHIIVAGDMMGEKKNPSVPFGYLFSLAQKHPHLGTKAAAHQTDAKLHQEIFELSTNIVAALDVEVYNVWETEFRTGSALVKLMRDLVVYDSNFKIAQTRSTDAKIILNGLFDWIAGSAYETSIPVKEIINFGRGLCKLIENKNTSVIVNRSQLKKLSQRSCITLGKLLDIFSHPATPPNANFLLPTDGDKADAETRPLIRLDRNRYWLPLQGSVLGAVVEAIRDYYRRSSPSFERELGDKFEAFVKALLSSRSIPIRCGKYREKKGVEPEIDVAIESTDLISLIEIKKKPLTRKAMIGSDFDLLIDVWQSLFDSQIQALRHEINLRRNGQIAFTDGTVLQYASQEFERISVVLTDFGSLQDKRTIDQILRFFSSARFSCSEADKNAKLLELNKKCESFVRLYDEWIALIGDQPNLPFLGCWFLSLPQLLLLLDDVNSAADFAKNLQATKCVTFKTMDFYFEYKKSRPA
jgi:CRISPR/Cas system-associated endoribonuclease Cas2